MGDPPNERGQVLFASEGVELVRHTDGRRELRLSDRALANMESTFDAIVAAIWLSEQSHPN